MLFNFFLWTIIIISNDISSSVMIYDNYTGEKQGYNHHQ